MNFGSQLLRHYSWLRFVIAALCVYLLLSITTGAEADAWPMAEELSQGTAYLLGQGVEQDTAEGISLMTAAAEGGNAQAQYALALLYRLGTVVEQDTERGLALLQSAAEAGVAEAQAVLGQSLLEELGEYESPGVGREWLQKAVDQGNVQAHYLLGKSFLEKTLQYYDEALPLLSVAAESGHGEAQLLLATAYYNGGYLYRSNTEPDYASAMRWFTAAAEQGIPRAITWLGYANSDGKALPENKASAVEYWLIAAEAGDERAMHALSLAYRDGEGVPASNAEYRVWLQRAAQAGDRGSQQALARYQAELERQNSQLVFGLAALGLMLGAANAPSGGGGYMDMSDPMQFWGANIMMSIK